MLHLGEIDAREVNSISLGADADGREIVVRVGRYGPYLQRGEDRAAVPDDLAPDEVTLEKAAELLENPSSDRVARPGPGHGQDRAICAQDASGRMYSSARRASRPTSRGRPRCLKTMDPAAVNLDEALRLLQLPRTVGADPETGEEIIAANGRFGPFLKRGNETRSLESEDQLFTVTIEEALGLFSAPKQRRYATSASPLRELGSDPESGSKIVLRSGRFGPYVTDGTTNASLRRGDDADELTLERALELIADRRAAGPSKRAGRRAGAKKAAGPQGDRGEKVGGRTTATTKKASTRKTTGSAKKTTGAKKAVRKATAAGAGRAAEGDRDAEGPGRRAADDEIRARVAGRRLVAIRPSRCAKLFQGPDAVESGRHERGVHGQETRG